MVSDGSAFGVVAAVRSLFETSNFSDLEIKCQESVFKVHKNIVASQGGFFSAISKKGFKEGDSGVIELQDEEPEVVLAMLKFLYGIEYGIPDGLEPAVFHADVYSTADFYQLPLLKQAAQKNFGALSTNPDAKSAKSCFNAAQAVYSGTPESDRGLRDLLVSTTDKHLIMVIDRDEGNQAILKDVPGLSYDLVRLRAQISSADQLTTLGCRCPNCNFEFTFKNRSGNHGRDYSSAQERNRPMHCPD